MGLKLVKDRGLSFFGIRARNVEFKEGGIKPEILVWSIVFKRIGLRRSKKCKYNSTGQPSRPGILSFL